MNSPLTTARTKRIEKLLGELERFRNEYRSGQRKQQISALSPRRQELIHTIRDHKEASFDFLARNFCVVPVSTLHYDLLQLMKKGYIQKMGSTRGVSYTLRDQQYVL